MHLEGKYKPKERKIVFSSKTNYLKVVFLESVLQLQQVNLNILEMHIKLFLLLKRKRILGTFLHQTVCTNMILLLQSVCLREPNVQEHDQPHFSKSKTISL